MKKNIPVPFIVKATQVLCVVTFIIYLVMVLLGDNMASKHFAAITAFAFGAIATTFALVYYKSGSWIYGIFNFLIGVGSYISYLFIAAA